MHAAPVRRHLLTFVAELVAIVARALSLEAQVGFGAGRIVYLSMRDAKSVHLARVRLR